MCLGLDRTFIRSSKFQAGVSTNQASRPSFFQPLQMSSILTRNKPRSPAVSLFFLNLDLPGFSLSIFFLLLQTRTPKFEELFFSVVRNEIIAPMPSEQQIVKLSIFPSITM